MKSLLENNIFFYSSICHIGKQINIWRVKFIESFGDALTILGDTFGGTFWWNWERESVSETL